MRPKSTGRIPTDFQRDKTLGYLGKLYTYPGNHLSQPSRATFERQDAELQRRVCDGGLSAGYCPNTMLSGGQWNHGPKCLEYSLNKRKRWLLPELLEATIDHLQPDDITGSVTCLRQVALGSRVPCSHKRSRNEALAISVARHEAAVLPGLEDLPKKTMARRNKRFSHLNDLVIRSERFKSRTKDLDGEELDSADEEFDSADAKRSDLAVKEDFGIMYIVGVSVPHDGILRNVRVVYHPVIRTGKAAQPNVPADLADHFGCAEDAESEEEEDVTTSAASARPSYNLAELMQESRLVKRRRRSRPTSILSESKSHVSIQYPKPESNVSESAESAYLNVPESTESVCPNVSESVETPSTDSVRVRAAEESQRTFFLQGSMTDCLSTVRSAGASITCIQTDSDMEVGIGIADIGLPVLSVLLVKPTFFGLEVTVKGPPVWLTTLPELTVLGDLNRFLSRQPKPVSVFYGLEGIFAFRGKSVSTRDVLYPLWESLSIQNVKMSEESTTVCLICCEEESVMLNGCGHGACPVCWKLHIVAKVSDGAAKIPCIMIDCKDIVQPAVIALLAPWHAVEAWQNRNLDLVVTSRQGKYCNTPRCTAIVLADCSVNEASNLGKDKRTLCRCNGCSKTFCWSCQEEWHWPCPCTNASAYRHHLISRGDDLWLRYITKPKYFAKTKSCPSCRLPMEKGEGCHNMTCNCGAQFCWTCARLTSAHISPEGDYISCFERPLNTVDVEDGLSLTCRETAYKMAVEWRNKRYALRRLKIDAEMKVTLSWLYRVLEFGAAWESQLSNSKRSGFKAKDSLRDLTFLVDLLLLHRDDERRLVFMERTKKLILKLQAECRTC